MEWMDQARLYLNYKEQSGLRCYHFSWLSRNPNMRPTDCYEDGDNYGHWLVFELFSSVWFFPSV